MEIKQLKVEYLNENIVTDNRKPRITFYVESSVQGDELKEATVTIGDWSKTFTSLIGIEYDGQPLKPFQEYVCKVKATTTSNQEDEKEIRFTMGRLDTPWVGKWITDGTYSFVEKNVSPIPLTFRKRFSLDKKVKSAKIYATAIGIYELNLNGEKVGKQYLAPGYTSYEHHLQYQTYDVSEQLKEQNEIIAVVGGGWAVGSFVMSRTNRIYADRQALLLELRIQYEDGSEEIIASDESFEVTREGNYKMVDIYDGETYDASIQLDFAKFIPAALETPRISPKIEATYGSPVICQRRLTPVSVKTMENGDIVVDFGQNFAGEPYLKIKNAKKGDVITIQHAEILKEDGYVNMALLRSAKQTATYICKDGEQEYSPRMSYFGFRYIQIHGIKEEDVEIEALVLYSDFENNGDFSCSDERINRLQENIRWSSYSNLFDIPTDCPQRDERMGWTGDIALFSPTAVYNFELTRFLEKWLKDLRVEQLKSGAVPTTIPHKGYGMPLTFPTIATDFWGDACILVPYAMYQARGDKRVLEENYETMKKYVNACKFWANLLSFGKRRYIWHNISFFHFGDWVAPGMSMGACQARHKWTATCSLFNTSSLLSKIAGILGKSEDEKKYKELSEKVADAYVSLLTDGNGKMKKEFQTAYVLPLHFKMFPEGQREKAADNLAALVKANDYKVGTGFPGTPYLLFALADNGHEEDAFKMLMQTKDPSWLHEVVTGGTTIWERFDGLDDDGKLNVPEDGTGGMISFNHYASGAIGAFLYSRVLGIEAKEAGYKTFTFKPLIGGGITHARGRVNTPYGWIEASWKKEDDELSMNLTVPCGAKCIVTLPDGSQKECVSGNYQF